MNYRESMNYIESLGKGYYAQVSESNSEPVLQEEDVKYIPDSQNDKTAPYAIAQPFQNKTITAVPANSDQSVTEKPVQENSRKPLSENPNRDALALLENISEYFKKMSEQLTGKGFIGEFEKCGSLFPFFGLLSDLRLRDDGPVANQADKVYYMPFFYGQSAESLLLMLGKRKKLANYFQKISSDARDETTRPHLQNMLSPYMEETTLLLELVRETKFTSKAR